MTYVARQRDSIDRASSIKGAQCGEKRRTPQHNGAKWGKAFDLWRLQRNLRQDLSFSASVQPLAYIPPTWRLHVEASDNWKANDRENEPCAWNWYLIAERQASRKEARFR